MIEDNSTEKGEVRHEKQPFCYTTLAGIIENVTLMQCSCIKCGDLLFSIAIIKSFGFSVNHCSYHCSFVVKRCLVYDLPVAIGRLDVN